MPVYLYYRSNWSSDKDVQGNAISLLMSNDNPKPIQSTIDSGKVAVMRYNEAIQATKEELTRIKETIRRNETATNPHQDTKRHKQDQF